MKLKFETIEEEKKKRIRQATLKEFAEKSYREASTDDIAQNAGVAKGSLFHYFGSKKTMYLHFLHEASALLTNEVMKEVHTLEIEDIFEWIQEVLIIKQKVMRHYPLQVAFLHHALQLEDTSLQKELQLFRQQEEERSVHIFREQFLKKTAHIVFREELTSEEAFFMTFTVFQSATDRWRQLHSRSLDEANGMDTLRKELQRYMTVIRYGLLSESTTRE